MSHRSNCRMEELEIRVMLAQVGLDLPFGDAGAAPVSGDLLVAPVADGKILAVSEHSAVRLNADGSVDPSFQLPADAFGSDGFSLSYLSVVKNATRLFFVFEGDGQTPTIRAFHLSDGSVDTSFGTNGVATIAIQPVPPQASNGVELGAAHPTPDGGLLLNVTQADNRLYKVTAAGKLDTTFGDNGSVPFGGEARVDLVDVAPNGKILVLDGTLDVDNVLERLNADGTLDTTFGTNGAVAGGEIPNVGFPFFYGLAATADAGALILVGSDNDGPQPAGIALIGGDGRTNRFFARSLDPDGNDTPRLFVQSDGKVIGTAGATLFRYNSDGSADTSFDNDGVVWIGGDAGGIFGGSDQVATDANGDILVGTSNTVSRHHAVVAAGAQISNGRLLINGSGSDDTITVDAAGDQITVAINGQTSTFAAADVTSIVIQAGDGNDLLTNNTNLPSTIIGGEGDDTITGGGSGDSLLGQGGNDVISGRDGNDTVLGESGRDSLSGNAGADSIFGGLGSDRVAGNGGRDHLYGGGGNDRMYGGASGDWLYGQGGSDQLFGGGGNDHLYVDYSQDVFFVSTLHGGAGNDTLVGLSNGVDQFFGDAGHDTASTVAIGSPSSGVTDILTSIEASI